MNEDQESTRLSGGCLCGAVRYELDRAPGPIVLCHCGQCRKAQGSAFVTVAPVATEAFRLVRGADRLRGFQSSPGKWRSFCGDCGSPIHSRRDDRPAMLRLRVGSLDEPFDQPPAAHIHVASKAAWWTIDDALPQYPGIEPGR
ncbi:GFA family protein [Methylibium sp.]|uniref:GFA family protein n=1 Tax=Methylibium sp. TaxID=2067992 RepID=UPI003BA938CF